MVAHGSCRCRCYSGTFILLIITKSLGIWSPVVAVLGLGLVALGCMGECGCVGEWVRGCVVLPGCGGPGWWSWVVGLRWWV